MSISNRPAAYPPLDPDAVLWSNRPPGAGSDLLVMMHGWSYADDVMRVIFAVTGGIYRDDQQRQRALQIVLDGIRPDSSREP